MSAISGIIFQSHYEGDLKETAKKLVNKGFSRAPFNEGYVVFSEAGANQFSGQNTHPLIKQQGDRPLLDLSEPKGKMAFCYSGKNPKEDFSLFDHQPIQIGEGRVWVVFDGEILNFKQIEKELRDEGYTPKSEAELIAYGYLVWEERVLNKLDGSFAFVLYDREENRLFGARDPFGVKPLYYAHSEDYFVFASEMKAIFGLPFVSKKTSKSAVFDYLILGKSDHTPGTIFRGIQEIPPGSAFSILLPRLNIKIWSYFNLTTDSKIDRYSRNKVSTLAHRLRKALINNVNEHLTQGTRTVYHLNEHIESFIFPYLIRESLKELPASERPLAKKLYSGCLFELESGEDVLENRNKHLEEEAKELEIDLLKSIFSPLQFMDSLEQVVYIQDSPFTNIEAVFQFEMLKKLKGASFDVVIEPTGAYQLFSSSPDHFVQFLEDLLSKGEYRLFLDNMLNYTNSYSSKWKIFATISKKFIFRKTADDLKESLIRADQGYFGYLKDHFLERYGKQLEDQIKSTPQSLNQLLLAQFSGTTVRESLRVSDRNAQYLGIEVRHPFASDRDLAESMLKASSIYKIRSGKQANLLRKAMRGVIPDEFYSRMEKPLSSNAFLGPCLSVHAEELKEYISPDLDDFIDSKKLKRDLTNLLLTSDPEGLEFLWRVINLGMWRKAYF